MLFSGCVSPPATEHCYDIEPGFVLSQDKYDPHFAPCPPPPVTPAAPPQDDDSDDDGQSSLIGGGNGVNAQEGDESSNAVAGEGVSAQQGDPDGSCMTARFPAAAMVPARPNAGGASAPTRGICCDFPPQSGSGRDR